MRIVLVEASSPAENVSGVVSLSVMVLKVSTSTVQVALVVALAPRGSTSNEQRAWRSR
jgi:hypothetical protein